MHNMASLVPKGMLEVKWVFGGARGGGGGGRGSCVSVIGERKRGEGGGCS